MNRRILVIYHRVDYDGILSCLTVKKYYEEKGIPSTLMGWNYGDDPIDVGKIIKNDYQNIVMTDISLPPEQMLKLKESGRLTWIDHHQTSISDSELHGYSDLPGIRKNGTAACELTWGYFYTKRETPMLIQYAGSYDVWNKTRFDWEANVVPLQYGLRETYGMNVKAVEKDWDLLCQNCDWILDTGIAIYSYIKRSSESWVKYNGFPVTVDGKYKGIALITPLTSSIAFSSVLDKYDLFLIVQIIDSGTKYSVSMYTEPDKDLGGFSCGEYLKENYGGGGHACAAGTRNLTREQFEKLIFDHEF